MRQTRSPVRCLAGLRRLGDGSGPTLALVTDHLAERSTPLAVILMAALALATYGCSEGNSIVSDGVIVELMPGH